MPPPKNENHLLSRRTMLKGMGMAPLLFRAAPFHSASFPLGLVNLFPDVNPAFPFSDIRLQPHYRANSPLEDVLRLVVPGADEYITEKYAFEIDALLRQWSDVLKASARDLSPMVKFLDASIETTDFVPAKEIALRTRDGIDISKRQFAAKVSAGSERFLQQMRAYLAQFSQLETAEFEIVSIDEIASEPLSLRLDIRYDFVAVRDDKRREERVGLWRTEWRRETAGAWKVRRWEAGEETVCVLRGPGFIDVTPQAFGKTESYKNQLLHGTDYWRTVLDGACGIDVYGNNGVASGDFDNDGFDDIYMCQPAGVPNRLYRNRGDGTFEDVTERAGVGVLDNTACALFADFENKGVQDLLVVCGSGPLLFMNQGNGTFVYKRDAFKFSRSPQGTFTHAAIADYDRDGRLDIYFCLYSYYLGLDQYHYPVPYYDARNGPPNFLMHNEGNATFVDATEAAGLHAENNRYSFACSWGDPAGNGLPSLYVANDFGRSNLYRNNGDGTFTAISDDAHIDDPGAGMSACWCDFDNDGKQDIYVANMWSAAGQRVAAQKIFHDAAPENTRALYRHHARGNSLYRNEGGGKFRNISQQAAVEMGRWSWSSDLWDFDHDGYSDLYIANGYISGPDKDKQVDLGSFFWQQVVAKSPDDNAPSQAYEHGWNALNELIRSDHSWSGYERNVMFANNRDGTFSEISGAVGLDFPEDSRSFALADIDHDGRFEIILKNRNAPQLRILRNAMQEIGTSIVFRLQGTKSNRDAIGAAITVEAGTLRQTKYLQAGSGFLAQHSKEVHFGLGKQAGAAVKAAIRWPNGSSQTFENLPVNHRVEIQEGSASFIAKAFSAIPAAYEQAAAHTELDPLPSVVDTWLIQPLKAPEFSLPDLAGHPLALQSLRGSYVLLNFWASIAPVSGDNLKLLHQHHTKFSAAGLQPIAINVDDASAANTARSFATNDKFSFPVVFATEDIAAIYNIIYRYLFDRRRDLAIPTSFLLDKQGMIVKVYQGPVRPELMLEDLRTMPATTAERMQKAIVLGGQLYQGAFRRNDFTYGVALFQHGYLDQAADSFQQVIAAKPDDPEAYYNLGTLYLRKDDLQQARGYLEKTVKLRSDYPEAWNNLGMIAAQQGSAEEAVRNFQQSLTYRPTFAIALLNLGNLYRREGAFDQAQQYLQKALEVQPDDPEINYGLGMFYAQQNQVQQASYYLQRAIELRPDYPQALNNLGVLFVRTKNYPKAEEQFKTCMRVAPGFDQSYLNLARLYAMQGNTENARGVLQDLLRLQPENSSARQAMEILK